MQRHTTERSELLRVFDEAERPLTAADLKRCLGDAVHAATVYRALNDLVESGLVRKVELGGRAAHYELNSDHHHHIVCTSCGDIEDVHQEPKWLEARALEHSRKFASVDTHTLEFFGVCKKCV